MACGLWARIPLEKLVFSWKMSLAQFFWSHFFAVYSVHIRTISRKSPPSIQRLIIYFPPEKFENDRDTEWKAPSKSNAKEWKLSNSWSNENNLNSIWMSICVQQALTLSSFDLASMQRYISPNWYWDLLFLVVSFSFLFRMLSSVSVIRIAPGRWVAKRRPKPKMCTAWAVRTVQSVAMYLSPKPICHFHFTLQIQTKNTRWSMCGASWVNAARYF